MFGNIHAFVVPVPVTPVAQSAMYCAAFAIAPPLILL